MDGVITGDRGGTSCYPHDDESPQILTRSNHLRGAGRNGRKLALRVPNRAGMGVNSIQGMPGPRGRGLSGQFNLCLAPDGEGGEGDCGRLRSWPVGTRLFPCCIGTGVYRRSVPWINLAFYGLTIGRYATDVCNKLHGNVILDRSSPA